MKLNLLSFAFAASVLGGVMDSNGGDGTICASDQCVVCSGNGQGGLLSLGNIAPGALGDSCSGGDVYCCDNQAVQNGLANLDLNVQCSLNHVL
ncbi:hypothetical protein N7478_010547 [Penicillium angulare]|uniref:uncharacterized protein n=1 Tax=Penicillium angulare TaxID=116970 RepID=UPI002540CE33|nr:uncharacterized protein N7478_010547 [Penicillium angulare]KAJ5267739.1 hypothetical protein N7478_010547 [Penicillium angulare]